MRESRRIVARSALECARPQSPLSNSAQPPTMSRKALDDDMPTQRERPDDEDVTQSEQP
jgi:hypothetical protein